MREDESSVVSEMFASLPASRDEKPLIEGRQNLSPAVEPQAEPRGRAQKGMRAPHPCGVTESLRLSPAEEKKKAVARKSNDL